jgi:cation transporter-like permease
VLGRAVACVLQGMQGRCRSTEGIVTLIVYYVVFMVMGDFAAYLIGLFSEHEWGDQVSLIVFLTFYFLFLWVAWVLAVWVTRPKSVEPAAS